MGQFAAERVYLRRGVTNPETGIVMTPYGAEYAGPAVPHEADVALGVELDGRLFLQDDSGGKVYFITGTSGGLGVTDHGALTGLADDDHPQYHNDARGDARYSLLAHVHDDRYFTETEADARFAPLVHNHDDRYFTETEADARFAPISHGHAFTEITGTITDTQHGARGRGTLHTVATTSEAGFMSSSDKSKLDGVAAGAQPGTVTSVAATVPSTLLSVAGSPITTSGTLAFSLPVRAANLVFAGPTTGVDAAPAFRGLVVADLPAHSSTHDDRYFTETEADARFAAISHVHSAADITSGTLASARGGTGVSNAGTITNQSNTTISGGGTLALAGFTFTVSATMTAAGRDVANTFTQPQTISAGTGNVFIVDTNTLVVDATNDRVGINQASPEASLHLRESVSTTASSISNRETGIESLSVYIERTGSFAVDQGAILGLGGWTGSTQVGRGILAAVSGRKANATGAHTAGILGLWVARDSDQTLNELVRLSGAGYLYPVTDASADLGISATNRWRSGYFSSDVQIGGNAAIGVTSPQGKLHGYDSIGGFLFWKFDGVAGTAQTVIPDGAGDVLQRLALVGGVIHDSSGASAIPAQIGIAVGVDSPIYTVGEPATHQLNLRVNANGSVDIRRTVGTRTYKVILWLMWL